VKLVFGVIDVAYSHDPANAPRVAAPPKIRKDGQPYKASMRRVAREFQSPPQYGAPTTGDVATWLENKYEVMATFYEMHREEITDIIGRWYLAKHEAIAMGAPVESVDMQGFIDEIAVLFHRFIDTKEMDGRAGIPTAASLKGINHRMKDRRTPGRPSFRDTGAYEGAFRAWLA
jgi:hypothetical protein